MPINPEEIGKAAQGIEKAVAAIEKSGGIGKAAESIASKGEQAVQSASKSARTYARDARGRFISVTKGALKTSATASAGAAVENLITSPKNSSDDSNQDSSQQPGASRNKVVPNPGAISPVGRIDLPHIDSAENIASTVDESAFTDTRGLKGSSDKGSENISNRKLNKIINLLESILSVEKRNTAIMGTGFRNVENAFFMSQNAIANRMQAQDMENTTSGKGGGFLGSVMSNPRAAVMGSLKSLGVAALGAFAAGAAIDVIKNHGDKKDTETRQAVSKTQKDIISNYKDEYGKRWAQKLVGDDFSQQQRDNGFLEELANGQGPAALYLPIKEAFDKASKKDKQDIIDAIAALLKVAPEKVEKQIAHENIRAVQVAKAAETGVMNAAIHAAASTVGGGIKYGGKAVGWLSTTAGSAFDFFGNHNIGSFLKKEGSTISKNATAKGDELSRNINSGTEYIPSTGKLNAFYNPNSYKAGEMSFDIGTAAFMPGGKIRTASMFAAGGLDLLGNDSKYFGQNTFQMDKKSGQQKKLTSEEEARAKKAIAFFQSKGWSKDQASAIVGNLLQESNLDPNAVNPKSKARGIAQWLGSRVKDFEKQEHTPLEGSGIEQQLDFVNWELNHSEKKAGDAIKATSNIQDATTAVANKYERMGADESMMDRRISYAEAVSKQFDVDSIKPRTQMASTAGPSSPITVSQGATNISRNTTIQSASAAAPSYLQDSVASSI